MSRCHSVGDSQNEGRGEVEQPRAKPRLIWKRPTIRHERRRSSSAKAVKDKDVYHPPEGNEREQDEDDGGPPPYKRHKMSSTIRSIPDFLGCDCTTASIKKAHLVVTRQAKTAAIGNIKAHQVRSNRSPKGDFDPLQDPSFLQKIRRRF